MMLAPAKTTVRPSTQPAATAASPSLIFVYPFPRSRWLPLRTDVLVEACFQSLVTLQAGRNLPDMFELLTDRPRTRRGISGRVDQAPWTQGTWATRTPQCVPPDAHGHPVREIVAVPACSAWSVMPETATTPVGATAAPTSPPQLARSDSRELPCLTVRSYAETQPLCFPVLWHPLTITGTDVRTAKLAAQRPRRVRTWRSSCGLADGMHCDIELLASRARSVPNSSASDGTPHGRTPWRYALVRRCLDRRQEDGTRPGHGCAPWPGRVWLR